MTSVPFILQCPSFGRDTSRKIPHRVSLTVQDSRSPLIKPFPRINEVLDELRARSIPCAIVSNKGIAAVRDILAANNLSSQIKLVVGDGEPVDCPKPDLESWTRVVKPFFEQETATRAEIKGLEGENVLVVGDTEADILYARNTGARSVWCAYGYGSRETCMDLKPDFIVKGLDEVIKILDLDERQEGKHVQVLES